MALCGLPKISWQAFMGLSKHQVRCLDAMWQTYCVALVTYYQDTATPGGKKKSQISVSLFTSTKGLFESWTIRLQEISEHL